MVLHSDPSFPADTTCTIPAALVALFRSSSIGGAQPSRQPQELLTTCGAMAGSAPAGSSMGYGAIIHSMQSM